ncbi:hypothetical protein GCM10010166_33790 [Couchioplanes caeruleus subsp. azureus]|nr:hypothetical protein GCM10010166_33790 [Couchioplanes caeruleus subsp. azureus]
MAAMTVLAALVAGGSGAAGAAGARFVPEAAEARWDGAVATVVFQEVDVALAGDLTTISVTATVDVDITCRRGESTVDIHRSATVTKANDYPIGADGTVAGTARLPLEVTGWQVPGYSCAARHWSVTAVLEDFWTGATLTHKA